MILIISLILDLKNKHFKNIFATVDFFYIVPSPLVQKNIT